MDLLHNFFYCLYGHIVNNENNNLFLSNLQHTSHYIQCIINFAENRLNQNWYFMHSEASQKKFSSLVFSILFSFLFIYFYDVLWCIMMLLSVLFPSITKCVAVSYIKSRVLIKTSKILSLTLWEMSDLVRFAFTTRDFILQVSSKKHPLIHTLILSCKISSDN